MGQSQGLGVSSSQTSLLALARASVKEDVGPRHSFLLARDVYGLGDAEAGIRPASPLHHGSESDLRPWGLPATLRNGLSTRNPAPKPPASPGQRC